MKSFLRAAMVFRENLAGMLLTLFRSLVRAALMSMGCALADLTMEWMDFMCLGVSFSAFLEKRVKLCSRFTTCFCSRE